MAQATNLLSEHVKAPDRGERKAGRTRHERKNSMAELKPKGDCDFCGEACNADMPGAKAYDCADFEMAFSGSMSYGAWGACPACAELIDSEKWEQLEECMTRMQRRRFGFVAEMMLAQLRRMHAEQIRLFRQHRIVTQ